MATQCRSQNPRTHAAGRIAALLTALWVATTPASTHAAGVVGTGTAASCTDAALDAALADGGSVTFNCGGPATIDLNTGAKTINADTTVDGGGLITISGGNQVGVFVVNPSVNFTVENLTLANGAGGLGGGAIANLGSGSLTVKNSSFTGNGAGTGGAISSDGPLTVTNSTFIGNSAQIGGAITAVGGETESEGFTVVVTNCTFTGNSGFIGGAIDGERVTLTVSNSTFANNSALANYGGPGNPGIGGAIAVNIGAFGAIRSGSLTVTNGTFTGNIALDSDQTGDPGVGSAIAIGTFFSPTPALLRNTILANSPSGANCVVGTITDGGHNVEDGASCGFSSASGSLSNTDAQLDPAGLQDHGGPTHTVALCTGAGVPAGCVAASPAIDAGDPAICAAAPVNHRDQRGFVRPGMSHTVCSIGAYEADAAPPEACTGDCAGVGTVAIGDLITLVNIALGSAPASACPNGIPNNADVDIALLVQAVDNALAGCAG